MPSRASGTYSVLYMTKLEVILISRKNSITLTTMFNFYCDKVVNNFVEMYCLQ